MNILVVCHYGMYGDLQNSFVHAQAKAYAALGHRVRALVPVPVGKKDRSGHRVMPSVTVQNVDGVEIVNLRVLSLSNFGAKGLNSFFIKQAVRNHFSKMFSSFRPDVIHAHTLGADSDLGIWLRKQLNCPLVVTTHGSDTSIPYAQGRKSWIAERCAGADHIVAVSSTLAKKLEACSVEPPVSVILNGFSVENLADKPWAEKKPLSFIQVGNLLQQKHFDTTIYAFRDILENNPSATLTIVGQGPEREHLVSLCETLGISQTVRFMGRLPNTKALQEMADAQFFCMPSVREGFGIVYLEAMASGCITIGTQDEGIADLIESGKNGFLVPPEDPGAIVRVVSWCLEHPDEAVAVAEQGKRAARELTWQQNAEAYVKLFQILFESE